MTLPQPATDRHGISSPKVPSCTHLSMPAPSGAFFGIYCLFPLWAHVVVTALVPWLPLSFAMSWGFLCFHMFHKGRRCHLPASNLARRSVVWTSREQPSLQHVLLGLWSQASQLCDVFRLTYSEPQFPHFLYWTSMVPTILGSVKLNEIKGVKYLAQCWCCWST